MKSLLLAVFLSTVIVLRGNRLTPASSNIWESACPQRGVFFFGWYKACVSVTGGIPWFRLWPDFMTSLSVYVSFMLVTQI